MTVSASRAACRRSCPVCPERRWWACARVYANSAPTTAPSRSSRTSWTRKLSGSPRHRFHLLRDLAGFEGRPAGDGDAAAERGRVPQRLLVPVCHRFRQRRAGQGQGGKYLLLPPGYTGEVPEGYHVLRSKTFRDLYFWRGFLVDGDPKAAVETIKKTLRIYPLVQALRPPPTKFISASGIAHNTIHANDFSLFEELNQIVPEEPSEALDPERLALFASIGIQKGKPFAPDVRMKKILTEAAVVGDANMVRQNLASG